MFNSVKRLIVIGILLLALTAAMSILTVAFNPGRWTPYLRATAIVLFAVGVFVAVSAARKKKRFNREDAEVVCHRANELIIQLRALAPILHKEYGNSQEARSRYKRDVRYKKLIRDYSGVKLMCSDFKLASKLHKRIEQEKLAAKYGLTDGAGLFSFDFVRTDEDIRSYINRRFKRREILSEE